MLNRRNSFLADPSRVEAQQRLQRNAGQFAMSEGAARPTIKPSVSRDVAEIAHHLGENPVFVDLMAELRAEAVRRMSDSPVGPSGALEREMGRYELSALEAIENRLRAIGAEFSLYPSADDHAAD